ncbi:MAG TPA: hypothetical protein VM389_13075 [Phycisphaerae bacterium]|nr:hypothetical protein [Phycisphaerae bacterium]HUX15759.1 hypothetical protein [Phycisphaerae bacterium]
MFGQSVGGNFGWVENQIRAGLLRPYNPVAGGKTYYAKPGLTYAQLPQSERWEQGGATYGPQTKGWAGTSISPARDVRRSWTHRSGQSAQAGRAGATGNPILDVLSPINTQGIYGNEQTEKALNQIYARGAEEAAMPAAMKAWDRPGASRDPGRAALAIQRKVIPALSEARSAAEGLRLSDRAANVQHLLETEQQGEMLAQGIAGRQLQQTGAGQADQQNALLSLLRMYLGGGF